MRRTYVALLSSIALILAGLTLASPAQAVPTDCTNGTICLYLNGTSPYAQVSSTSGGIARNTCIAAAEQTGISYAYNRTGFRWFLFRDSTCAGAHLEVPPGYAGQVQVLVGGSGWDNDVTRMFRTSGTS